MLDRDSRLRVARGIAKNETLASIQVFKTLKRRGHPEGPPPTISDGWGGIDDAMIQVYGVVPEYSGRGRPPTRKRARPGWLYLQMVKQRDERGRVKGIKLRVVFGKKSELQQLHPLCNILFTIIIGPCRAGPISGAIIWCLCVGPTRKIRTTQQ